MIQINETVWALRLNALFVQLVLPGGKTVILTLADVNALREVLTHEGIGGCSCQPGVLSAPDCLRKLVDGSWQWCCPICQLPIPPFPF